MNWLDYWPIALFVLNGAFGWFLWSMRARFASKAEVAELDNRLTRAEGRVDGMPRAEAVHELALAVTKVGGQISTIGAQLDGLEKLIGRLESTVSRQEEHLLRGGS